MATVARLIFGFTKTMEVATKDTTAEVIRARLNANHFEHGNGEPTFVAILDTPTGARVVQALDLDFLMTYIMDIQHSKHWIFTMHTAQ